MYASLPATVGRWLEPGDILASPWACYRTQPPRRLAQASDPGTRPRRDCQRGRAHSGGGDCGITPRYRSRAHQRLRVPCVARRPHIRRTARCSRTIRVPESA